MLFYNREFISQLLKTCNCHPLTAHSVMEIDQNWFLVNVSRAGTDHFKLSLLSLLLFLLPKISFFHHSKVALLKGLLLCILFLPTQFLSLHRSILGTGFEFISAAKTTLSDPQVFTRVTAMYAEVRLGRFILSISPTHEQGVPCNIWQSAFLSLPKLQCADLVTYRNALYF